MIDPILERKYADTAELLDRWREFHELLSRGVKGDGIKTEDEERFLEVKSKIAVLHDSFMEALTADKNIGQSVMSIVTRAITLHHLTRMSVAEVKKIEIEWHEAFLLLQETVGNLEDKRAEIAEISEAAFRAEQFRHNTKQRIDHFLKSNTFRGMVIFAVVMFATVGVQVLGIWDWSNLKNYPITRDAFYAAYDRGVRRVLREVPYYRLEWVVFADDPLESRAFLSEHNIEGWWLYDTTVETNLPREVRDHDLDDLLERAPLNAQTLSSVLDDRNEAKVIWFNNARDFYALNLCLMDSSRQAQNLADAIRSELSDSVWGNVFATATRANILIIVEFVSVEGGSEGALSPFTQAAPQLIW